MESMYDSMGYIRIGYNKLIDVIDVICLFPLPITQYLVRYAR